MADIKTYTDQIQNAVYGEEVRSSIINALNKVNDDNNSYQSIKDAVVAAKNDVDTQQASIASNLKAGAVTLADLRSATSVATSTKSDLDDVVATAASTNDTLTATNKSATDANTALKSTVASADTANTTLKNTINTANAANTTLTATIGSTNAATANANTAKSKLDTSIATANETNSTLKSTISTANSNLTTTISNANTAKSQLQDVINSADTSKSNLSGTITDAETAKKNLDTFASNASGKLAALQAENASAKSNIQQLQDENFNSQEILSGVADLRAYLGLADSDVVGLQCDWKNSTFTRLAAAKGLNAGSDFDQFTPFGGRKRCNLSDDGTVLAWYGEDGYKEDGSNGQVMVYQPSFYYLVAPVEYEKADSGVGYVLRKANYYISAKPRAGFRLHPAFYDANGNQLDHIFYSAYRGSIYDTSASAYLAADEQVMDQAADLFCSIAGVKPASGYSQDLQWSKIEQMAQNRGSGWHNALVKSEEAQKLLMLIEYGGQNLQTAIGNGIVSFPWTDLASDNNSSYAVNTGGTASLGNASGMASSSTQVINGQTLSNTGNGKVSVAYRGVEDPWGDMWLSVGGVNIYGNGKMNRGQAYICKDFTFNQTKITDNYEPVGFYTSPTEGYISAFGYSTNYDWLFIPAETKGNSSLPVGDYFYGSENLNGNRIVLQGGIWYHGLPAGAFNWALKSGVGDRSRGCGGRLVYYPTATTA